MRIVKIFIWTEEGQTGGGVDVRMKCLVTGEDSIALGPNKLVYTFLVAQFLMSTGKPETHTANTRTHTHIGKHTHTHTQTLACLCLCCPWFWLLTFLCRSIRAHSATFKSNELPEIFLLLFAISLFISIFSSLIFLYFCRRVFCTFYAVVTALYGNCFGV